MEGKGKGRPRKENLFQGSSSKAQYARKAYQLLKEREWVTNRDIAGIGDDEKITNVIDYCELKKAVLELMSTLKEVLGDDCIKERGNNRNRSFRCDGIENGPLDDLYENAQTGADLQRYWDFCCNPVGFMPVSWIKYFMRGTVQLFKLRKASREGGVIISTDVGVREVNNVEMIPQLYDSIKSKQVLDILFQPYGEEQEKLRFHPHFLREFNGRWFVLGYAEGKSQTPWVLAVDRIQGNPVVCGDSSQYVSPPSSDFYRKYFGNIVGVTHEKSAEAVDVVVRAYSIYMYGLVKTKPIHESQEPLGVFCKHEDGREYGDFKLHVECNNEFLGRILQMGNLLEVVSPETVRSKFRKRVEEMLHRYTDTMNNE